MKRHKNKIIRRYAPTQDETGNSYLETLFMKVILTNRLPFPRREYPVGPYSIDFAYPVPMVGIELDGNQHFTEKGRLHDQQRDAFLTACGWCILRADRNGFYTPEFIRLIRTTINQRIWRLNCDRNQTGCCG